MEAISIFIEYAKPVAFYLLMMYVAFVLLDKGYLD